MTAPGSAVDAALLALGWLGAGLATLLAAALIARRGETGERWLGAGLAIAAAACTLVTLSHAGYASAALERAEVAVTLVAGPLVAGWLAHGAGWRAPRGLAVAAATPAAAWVVAAIAGAGLTADRTAIRWAVGLQISWTVAAGALVVRRWPRLGAATRRALAGGGAVLAALHGAQLVRLAAPGQASPRNLVPAALGLALAGVTWAALRQTRLAFAGGAGAGIDDERARELVAALDRWLVGEHALTERGLTVASAAARLGVPAASLSRALNRGAGVSFSDHLAALRVAEAERLLGDPALAHLAVEAIGGRAGFGSRSAFYAEFRRRTGQTPAEFRERAAPPQADGVLRRGDVRNRDSGATSDVPGRSLVGALLELRRAGRDAMTSIRLRCFALTALVLSSIFVACASPPPLPKRAELPAPGYVPPAEWERLADPASHGWDAGRLAAARAIWDGNSGTSAVMVVWRGAVVAQWGDVAAKWTGRSIRKSLLSGLLAEPVLDGRLRWDATLAELGVDDRTPLTEVERRASVGDLLASRSGVYLAAARENSGHRKRRPERGSHPPGSFFYYNNWDFNVLGVLYRDRIAADVGGEFARRIAEPIGMEDFLPSDFEWRPERVSPHPAYDFEMSTRDLARYGLLWLRGGRWGARELIPREWIARSTTAVTPETWSGAGYGLLWWVQPPGRSELLPEGYYFAEGGSYLWVVPSRDLVIVHHRASDLVLVRSKLGLLPDERKVWEIFAEVVKAAPSGA